MASIIAPCTIYKYNQGVNDKRLPFEEVFSDDKEDDFDNFTTIIMHDAVNNTAMFWNHVWLKTLT